LRLLLFQNLELKFSFIRTIGSVGWRKVSCSSTKATGSWTASFRSKKWNVAKQDLPSLHRGTRWPKTFLKNRCAGMTRFEKADRSERELCVFSWIPVNHWMRIIIPSIVRDSAVIAAIPMSAINFTVDQYPKSAKESGRSRYFQSRKWYRRSYPIEAISLNHIAFVPYSKLPNGAGTSAEVKLATNWDGLNPRKALRSVNRLMPCRIAFAFSESCQRNEMASIILSVMLGIEVTRPGLGYRPNSVQFSSSLVCIELHDRGYQRTRE
jgi:hypothetical protein